MKSFPRAAAALFATAVLTPAAQAHLVTSGLGPFYDGVAHFVFTPVDWLAALAIALFAGLQEKRVARVVLWLVPLAWLAGGVAGFLTQFGEETISAAVLLVLGVAVASAPRCGVGFTAGFTALAAVGLGLVDGAGLAAGTSPGVALLGGVVAVTLLLPLVAALVISIERAWLRIAVRVAGSWIAATGLLLLGWIWRGHFR